jgi:MinD-like ATPase involved in chromosome partitioning or flagellar assembly
VAAFTVGVTSARFEACKRGLAANYAATLATRVGSSVCLVDADPRSCDVGTRLGVSAPTLARFVAPKLAGDVEELDARVLPNLAYPPLAVLPTSPAYIDADYRPQFNAALTATRAVFGTVVVDLPVGAGRPGPTLDGRLVDRLDAILLAVTPDRAALAATLRHLELFAEAHGRGAIAPHVAIGVVMTGDEASCHLDPLDVAERLGDACVGHVPQLWGRSLPNLGFGPTLGFRFVETEVEHIHAELATRHAARVVAARDAAALRSI